LLVRLTAPGSKKDIGHNKLFANLG